MTLGEKSIIAATVIMLCLAISAALNIPKLGYMNLIGVISYSVLAFFVYFKSNIARYASFAALLTHALIIVLILAALLAVGQNSPQNIEATNEGVQHVFTLEVDVMHELYKALFRLAAIAASIFFLANKYASKEFKKSA